MRRSTPPQRQLPDAGSARRSSTRACSCPAPLAPTRATSSPGASDTSTASRTALLPLRVAEGHAFERRRRRTRRIVRTRPSWSWVKGSLAAAPQEPAGLNRHRQGGRGDRSSRARPSLLEGSRFLFVLPPAWLAGAHPGKQLSGHDAGPPALRVGEAATAMWPEQSRRVRVPQSWGRRRLFRAGRVPGPRPQRSSRPLQRRRLHPGGRSSALCRRGTTSRVSNCMDRSSQSVASRTLTTALAQLARSDPRMTSTSSTGEPEPRDRQAVHERGVEPLSIKIKSNMQHERGPSRARFAIKTCPCKAVLSRRPRHASSFDK
jgi:hypothetical protein